MSTEITVRGSFSAFRPAPVAELVPEHIEVSATVDARCIAGPTAGGPA